MLIVVKYRAIYIPQVLKKIIFFDSCSIQDIL